MPKEPVQHDKDRVVTSVAARVIRRNLVWTSSITNICVGAQYVKQQSSRRPIQTWVLTLHRNDGSKPIINLYQLFDMLHFLLLKKVSKISFTWGLKDKITYQRKLLIFVLFIALILHFWWWCIIPRQQMKRTASKKDRTYLHKIRFNIPLLVSKKISNKIWYQIIKTPNPSGFLWTNHTTKIIQFSHQSRGRPALSRAE